MITFWRSMWPWCHRKHGGWHFFLNWSPRAAASHSCCILGSSREVNSTQLRLHFRKKNPPDLRASGEVDEAGGEALHRKLLEKASRRYVEERKKTKLMIGLILKEMGKDILNQLMTVLKVCFWTIVPENVFFFSKLNFCCNASFRANCGHFMIVYDIGVYFFFSPFDSTIECEFIVCY